MRIEIRGNQVLLDGYVNAVGRESRILPSPRGPFKEQIVPGTFQKALGKTDNVDMYFNHDEKRKLGSTKDGNLQLYEDNIGLRAIATVTDEEVIQKAKDGKLTGWSFGFVDQKPNWQDGENGIQKRFLEDIDLKEVSILDKTPAYIATSIEARGDVSVITELRHEETNVKVNVVEDSRKKEEKRMDTSCFQAMIDSCKACINDCKACIDFCNQLLKSTTDPALIAYCQACILQCTCCITCCESCIGCCELCLKCYQQTGSAPTLDLSVFEQQIAKLKGGMM